MFQWLRGALVRSRTRRKSIFTSDLALGRIVDSVVDECEYIVALGGGAHAAALHLARRHPDRECLACEFDPDAYHASLNAARNHKNFYLYNLAPQEFLSRVKEEKPYLFSRDVFVCIDASGGGPGRRFAWEVGFVCQRFRAAFVLIVGCRVPGNVDFVGYDMGGKSFTMRALAPAFKGLEGALYYPAYHVSVRQRGKLPGWGLLTLSSNALYEFPAAVKGLVRRVG